MKIDQGKDPGPEGVEGEAGLMPGTEGRFDVAGYCPDSVYQSFGLVVSNAKVVEKRSGQTTPDFFTRIPAVVGRRFFYEGI